MSSHLFTYGTLEFAVVYYAITGEHKTGVPATLSGYERYLLKGQAYPGIIARADATFTGTLYLDVDPVAMRKIENYEDTCYERSLLRVSTAEQQNIEAWAFVIPPDKGNLLSNQPWDQQQFIDQHLEAFLRYIR